MKTRKQDAVPAIVAVLSAVLFPAFGAPRGPLPPLPEVPPPLSRLHFDEAYSFSTNRLASVVTGYGTVVESFSGYALARDGESVPAFVVPALDASSHTNVASVGAIRFWFHRSAQMGNARLLEIIVLQNQTVAVNLSLHWNEDGSAICLDAATTGRAG